MCWRGRNLFQHTLFQEFVSHSRDASRGRIAFLFKRSRTRLSFFTFKTEKITKHFHKYFDIYILRGKPFFTQVISGTRVEPKRRPQSALLLGSNKIESFLLKMKRINILMVYSLLQFKLIQLFKSEFHLILYQSIAL